MEAFLIPFFIHMQKPIQNISIIGSGNVATQMAIALHKAGINIAEVFSASPTNAEILANKVNASVVKNIQDISKDADLYLLSVSDKAYDQILPNFPVKNKLVAHTAGSLSMEILAKQSKKYGVLYPFQTLSKNKEINFSEVPILYCGSNQETQKSLKSLAERISNKVSFASDEQRKYIHISAVFACNFVNHMYTLAKSITEEHHIDFALLYPLIKETAEKALSGNPKNMQTGPAVRDDKNILSNHIQLLKETPELQAIYRQLSYSIIKQHYKNGEEL